MKFALAVGNRILPTAAKNANEANLLAQEYIDVHPNARCCVIKYMKSYSTDTVTTRTVVEEDFS